MKVFYTEQELSAFLQNDPVSYPILIDTFLQGLEAEVDVLTDGEDIFIPGIFEHIEGTGVHSGDSLTVTPPQTLSESIQDHLITLSKKIAANMNYKGLFNIQFAIKDQDVYVIEVNPRASRTAPIMSKITNVNLVQQATELLLGTPLSQLQLEKVHNGQPFITVKAPVYSTIKLPGVSPVLCPMMTSTGEAIGTDKEYTKALLKALKGSTLQLNDIWNFEGSIFAEGQSAIAESENWSKLGFCVLTEQDLSFEEWLQTENKVAYMNFTDETENKTAKIAVLERMHIFTREETAQAFLQAAVYLQDSRKEVLI
jgi:carbamoyl-phosphate synthase large subunit